MNDKNKNFDKDVPDEVFERVAAEKRRKLEEFLKGLEQQETAHRSADATMTIHSDLFVSDKRRHDGSGNSVRRTESLRKDPEDTQRADEWNGDEDVKIFGEPPVKERPEPELSSKETEVPENDTLSLFEQDHIVEEELMQAKLMAQQKQEKAESQPEPEQSGNGEGDASVLSTQELLKQARDEKIKTFALDQNLDLEKQEEDGATDEEEDEDDEAEYEYRPDSDVEKIRGDFASWKSRRLLQIWISAVCFVLMALIVIAPALPFRLMPYTFAAGSSASDTSEPEMDQESGQTVSQTSSVGLAPMTYTASTASAGGTVGGVLTSDAASLPQSQTQSADAPELEPAVQPNSAAAEVPGNRTEDTQLTVNPKAAQVRILLIVLIGISLVMLIFSFDTLRDGAQDFFCMNSTYQSGAFVVYLVCLLQAVWLAIDPAQTNFVSGVMGVFMPASALAVLCAELATYLRLGRDENNFEIISSGSARHLRVQNIGDSNALERPRGDADCATAVFTPASFSSDFFAMADCEDGCDRAERIFVPAVLVAGLLAGFAAFMLNHKDPAYFITVFAAFVCAVMPISMGLFTVIGQFRAARAGRELGFAISNQFAYEDATEMTSVVVKDTEIFSAKSMVLHGIKTFNDKRMDEAIVIAASASQKRGGPLRELFSGILSENEAYLMEVDNETVYQPEKGMVCWISGKRVVMGTREFVGGYDIELPDVDYESKYCKNGRSLVYLALGNEMMAIFVVSYRVIPEIGALLRGVNACGVTILVSTNDPCLTAKMLCRALKLPVGSVLVLNAQGKDVYEKVTEPCAALKSGVVCNGGTCSELMAVIDSFRLRRSQSAGMGMQYALMAIIAVVLLMEVLFGKFTALSFGFIFLVQSISAVLLCVLQLLFRYRYKRKK